MADNNGAQVGVAQTQPATPAANPQDGTPQPVPVDATEVIKVNGKEVRLTKAQLVAMAQKGYFADSKLKSIDVLQKSAQALIAGLKTPEGVARILKDPSLGADFKATLKQMVSENADDEDIRDFLSQVVYEKVVKQSKKTPEQIEQEKKLSDYERLKKADEERRQKDQTAAQQAQVQRIYQAVRSEVVKQITADIAFPQVEGSIRNVIEKLRVINRAGAQITSESVAKAIALVKKDHLAHQHALLDAIQDPEALIAEIGEERALKISKALIARLKATQKNEGTDPKKQDGATPKTIDDVLAKNGRTKHGFKILNL